MLFTKLLLVDPNIFVGWLLLAAKIFGLLFEVFGIVLAKFEEKIFALLEKMFEVKVELVEKGLILLFALLIKGLVLFEKTLPNSLHHVPLQFLK